LIDSDKSSANGKDSGRVSGSCRGHLSLCVSPGVNVARFLQLIAALLMTGIFQGSDPQSRFSPAGCMKN